MYCFFLEFLNLCFYKGLETEKNKMLCGCFGILPHIVAFSSLQGGDPIPVNVVDIMLFT